MKHLGKYILIIFLLSFTAIASDQPESDIENNNIIFLDREEALNLVMPNLPHSGCVRVPAWELAVGDRFHSGFTTEKSSVNCREMFESVVRDFPDEDKETLAYYVSLIDSIVKSEFPALGSFPWSFILICDSADFKSFSTVQHIILTSDLIAVMREQMERQSSMKFIGLEILIHEKVRVLQLMSPEPFNNFYKETWGFKRIKAPIIADNLRERGHTIASISPKEWVIKVSPRDKTYILPGLIRRDTGAGGVGSFHRVAITIDSTSKGFTARKGKRTSIDYRDLGTLTQYRKRFPLSQYDYDPSELSADLIAKYLVMKYVSANFGTAPTRAADYSEIERLMTSVDRVVY
ncbi:MAG: hypothetical protein FWE57_07945 [Chitinispirillia bacterium]|nr:hypothetical protein [Chitinispirillia bacterium]